MDESAVDEGQQWMSVSSACTDVKDSADFPDLPRSPPPTCGTDREAFARARLSGTSGLPARSSEAGVKMLHASGVIQRVNIAGKECVLSFLLFLSMEYCNVS